MVTISPFRRLGHTMLKLDHDHIDTDRLVLRRTEDGDIARLVELANNPAVAENLSRMPHPYGEADARSWLEELHRLPDGAAVFAIGLKAERGAFIGSCSYGPESGEVDLGYWLGQPYWGRGYATEAGAAILAHAFEVNGVDRITAGCRLDNLASRRTLEKLGFQPVGRSSSFSLGAGRNFELDTFELARDRWHLSPGIIWQGAESRT
jgi:RimJ/RimL family protein N-acetyltransferase